MTRDNQMMHQFIKAKHKEIHFELKEGTKTSYYQISGMHGILPQRLAFMEYTGREGIRSATFQIKGRYKVNEPGLYYAMNQREIHSKICKITDFPMFTGWGDIDHRFKRYDLIVIHSSNQCKQSFVIHHFEGLAKPEYLNNVCQYLKTYLKQQRP